MNSFHGCCIVAAALELGDWLKFTYRRILYRDVLNTFVNAPNLFNNRPANHLPRLWSPGRYHFQFFTYNTATFN